MRTTLNIDDQLMARIKAIASKTNQTMTQVIEDILRQGIAGEHPQKQRHKLRWVTVQGRIMPGVDLADRDSLYERMEDR